MIMRRGQGLCVDDDLYTGVETYVHEISGGAAARFLCVHGHKQPERFANLVGKSCIHALEHCIRSLMGCSKSLQDPAVLLRVVRSAAIKRMGLGQVNDVGHCWPDCTANLSRSEWSSLQPGLKANAECSLSDSDWASFGSGCCRGTCLPKASIGTRRGASASTTSGLLPRGRSRARFQ